MAARTDDSVLFVAEWYDPLPQMKKRYLLKYFTEQHMAEMIDLKSRKVFLKKSVCPDTLSKDDFYVGSKILLYSRELEIVDFGDLKTKDRFQHQIQKMVVLLPNSSYTGWGKLVDELTHADMSLVQAKTIIFSPNIADKIIAIVEENPRKGVELSEGVTLALLLHAEDGYSRVKDIVQRFSSSNNGTIFYASNGLQAADIYSYVFDANLPSTCTLDHCTCCVIKPHAVKARQVGEIFEQIISQGYEISAVRSLQFDKAQAEEFLEVYKGVIPEYTDHVIQLCSGLSIALEIRAQNAVETFRVTAGPWDVEMAKELRPDTIRGRFGVNRILNVLHTTDLAEDGELECEYCFKLM